MSHRIRHEGHVHSSVAEVHDCHWQAEMDRAQAEDELAAEAAAERYFEEGTEAQHLQYLGELEMESAALGRPWWS